METQFVHEPIAKCLGRTRADAQPGGNFATGVAFGRELQHCTLASGERCTAGQRMRLSQLL